MMRLAGAAMIVPALHYPILMPVGNLFFILVGVVLLTVPRPVSR